MFLKRTWRSLVYNKTTSLINFAELTVSIQSVRAAPANPVEALRDE